MEQITITTRPTLIASPGPATAGRLRTASVCQSTEHRPSKCHTGDRLCRATIVTYHVSRGLYFLNIYKICKAEAHIETDLEFKRTAGIERVNETSASRKWTTALKRKK